MLFLFLTLSISFKRASRIFKEKYPEKYDLYFKKSKVPVLVNLSISESIAYSNRNGIKFLSSKDSLLYSDVDFLHQRKIFVVAGWALILLIILIALSTIAFFVFIPDALNQKI